MIEGCLVVIPACLRFKLRVNSEKGHFLCWVYMGPLISIKKVCAGLIPMVTIIPVSHAAIRLIQIALNLQLVSPRRKSS